MFIRTLRFFFPRHWRRQLETNPVLRLETRLWPGRPRWKSPVFWALVLAGLGLAYQIVMLAADSPLLMSLFQDVWPNEWSVVSIVASNPYDGAGSINPGDGILVGMGSWVRGVASLYLVVAIPFFSWRRERDPASREMIALSGLTVEDLLDARVRCWTALVVGIPLAFCAVDAARYGLAAMLMREDIPYHNGWPGMFDAFETYWIGDRAVTPVAWFFAHAIAMSLLRWLTMSAYLCLIMSVATRIQPGRKGNPLLALLPHATATLIMYLALTCLERFMSRALFETNLSFATSYVIAAALLAGAVWLLERIVWRGVPARIARAYGIPLGPRKR